MQPIINGGIPTPVLPFGYAVTPNSSTWASALSAEFNQPYFAALQQFVAMERQLYTVYPPPDQVYTWTQMCSIQNVKVVIIGQDPYHNPGEAHGLCLSVPHGIPPPPSLQNVFKELSNDIIGFQHPGHGNLTGWAIQGVLLLNTILTVRANIGLSHQGRGWEHFTNAVITWLNFKRSGIVFMLWGEYAKKKAALIDHQRHCVLMSSHPSPLSAYRGFLGCRHFSTANQYLHQTGQQPIDWTKL